ncbi:MAG: alpha-ketoacid dehydrogenase subunit beta [Anaerolineae bacterium]|nr:alpha-ketoacid dehydrogenase subunit beta [Anaerolineae bacterium]
MPVRTYLEAITDALREEMRRNPDVFIMGEDIYAYGGSYAVTSNLADEFGPERIRDTPIAEGAIAGVATGAAMAGLRPVAEIMTINFALLALDAIINHAAKVHYMFGARIKAPVIIRTAGGAGAQLGATHAQNFEVYFAHVPGLKVVTPATPADAKGLLLAAFRQDDPVIFIENTGLYRTKGEVPDGDVIVPFGSADVKREGKDVTLICYSRQFLTAMQAAEQLSEMGIEAEVVDLRSLRPWDAETVINSVKKTNRGLIIEEDWQSYGIGAEIAATVTREAFDWLDGPIERLGLVEAPMPYARDLERAAMPSPDKVITRLREMGVVR